MQRNLGIDTAEKLNILLEYGVLLPVKMGK